MRSYGQFCPVAKAAELFCERWTPLILRDLGSGATRFSELHRGVPLMSPALLSRRLKQLEAEGVLVRRRQRKRKGWSYHLTPAGEEFLPLVETLGIWGQRWARRQLADNEVDLGLLIWSLERGVDPDAFGTEKPAVVQLRFTDLAAARQSWWFVNREGACELCLNDPGLEISLYLACTLRDMIYILRGDLALGRAIDDGRLEALGSSAARRALRAWLNLSPLAKIRSRRDSLATPPRPARDSAGRRRA